ncbi:MAG: cell division transport system permease protein [Actinomycetota bacterium]|jgi:cell division transport system permease protein|nr:cell division transport system permease protein [Actinomycetota bacterium]MDQ1665546.1 cell division transport system permease protein [Actinomycetota bacterium]
MRARFLLSEITIGLRRNMTMTVAMVITTAVSLGFLGTAILFNQQVGVMKTYWYDKVEVSVFLCGQDSSQPSCAAGEVTQAQRDEIRSDLDALPQVEKIYYESKNQAYKRFKEQFKNSAIVDNVSPDQMPESYRVKLVNPEQFPIIASAFAGRPGIDEVQDQRALLERLFEVLKWVQWFAFCLALLMVVVSTILIVNTIRVSAFSRRRETGIMRLVGASSFSIQLPFLLEGAISGFVGALLASGSFVLIKGVLVDRVLAPNFPISQFITWGDVWLSGGVVFLVGITLAAVASFFALLKYLRV